MARITKREEVFSRIADASLFGHLGFFVGSGLSKALTIGDDHPEVWQHAPNFRELLERLAASLDLPLDVNSVDMLRGKSYPQLASALFDAFLAKEGIRRTQGAAKFKRQIAAICNFVPLPALLDKYRKILRHDSRGGLAPSWFITTNYDFLIEMVIDSALPLLPNEAFTPRADQVPVYHLHGHRLQPDSIVITEEDYVHLMGPVAYRQWKLGLLLAESTTVMLGYSLGDINVKVAHKLSRTFKEADGFVQKKYQGFVVQALFVDDRKLRRQPYVGPDGELVVEIDSILRFLKEASAARRAKVAELKVVSENLNEALIGATDDVLSSNSDARKIFIQYLKEYPNSYRASEIVGVFKRLLDPLWDNARKYGGWEFYDKFLSFHLDVLEAVQIYEIHPAIARYLLDNVVRVAWHLSEPGRDPIKGEAWHASRTWAKRRNALPERTLLELSSMAQQRGLTRVLEVLGY